MRVKQVVLITAVFCIVRLANSTRSDHHETFLTPKPGRISYFDTFRKSTGHRHDMKIIQNNQSVLIELGYIFRKLSIISHIDEILLNQSDKRKLPEAFQTILMRASSNRGETDLQYESCLNDTGRVLLGIMNGHHWAVQMFDSIGKPGPSVTQGRFNWVGNYQQCSDAIVPPDSELFSQHFKGTYTIVRFRLHLVTFHGLQLQWCLCFPDTCSSSQIYNIFDETLKVFNITQLSVVKWPEARVNNREMTVATYASLVIIITTGVLMLFGTFYDIRYIQCTKWSNERTSNQHKEIETNTYHSLPDNIAPNTKQIRGQHGKSHLKQTYSRTQDQPAFIKLILSFSVYTNTSKFCNTSQQPGSLSAVHGIRFLSMSWVVLGHLYGFGTDYVINLMDYSENIANRWSLDVVTNAFPSVDSFYTLSGLLISYLTVNEFQKRKTWKINWWMFYFHRFWRLTPPYMLTMVLVLGLQQYLGSGALWSNIQPDDRENCEENWWQNLLYINSIVDIRKSCFGHTWYLGNDMIYFVLSPIMLIPFFFSHIAGLISCCGVMLIHMLTTGILSTQNKWPTSSMAQVPPDEYQLIQDYETNYYFKPWTRMGPYIVGVAAGGLLAGKNIRLTRGSSLLCWLVFTASGLAVVYGLRGDISARHMSSVGAAALYNTVSRSVWAACVCWVVVACSLGYGGLVNSFLSWAPFVSLGRLTYMAYLIHPVILYVWYQSMGQLFYIKDLTMAVSYAGMMVIINGVAFVLMLGFESPMIGVEKVFLPRHRD